MDSRADKLPAETLSEYPLHASPQKALHLLSDDGIQALAHPAELSGYGKRISFIDIILSTHLIKTTYHQITANEFQRCTGQ